MYRIFKAQFIQKEAMDDMSISLGEKSIRTTRASQEISNLAEQIDLNVCLDALGWDLIINGLQCMMNVFTPEAFFQTLA
jgi:hypothetical protein